MPEEIPDFQEYESYWNFIYYEESEDTLILGILPKYSVIIKICVFLTSFIPGIGILISIGSGGDSRFFAFLLLLWIGGFCIMFAFGWMYRKDEEKKLITITSGQPHQLAYWGYTINIDKHSQFKVTTYSYRFNHMLVKASIKTGEDELELRPHKLLRPLVDFISARFSIEIETSIDDRIPPFAMSPYQSKMIGEEPVDHTMVRIGLTKNQSRVKYPFILILVFPTMIIGIPLLWLALHSSSSVFVSYSLPVLVMVIIVYRFSRLNRETNHITDVLIDAETRLVSIGEKTVMVPEKAKLEQMYVNIRSQTYLDSKLVWFGDEFLLPFFNDITYTMDMNEKVAKELNLKIEEIRSQIEKSSTTNKISID